MKVLLSWLNDYVDAGDDADAVAAALTSLGLAVDDVIHVGATVPGVVTARVVRTERHPDAAKVHRVYVDAGDGAERHVWCGAFNMSAGDVVPLATLGATMPDGRTIERRGILGIDSEGMLCSARELGLGDDHSGIMLLPPGTPLGVPYGEALGIEPDVVLDIDVTRNRPDAWGYVGIARDLAARLGRPLRAPMPVVGELGHARSAPVTIAAGERCGRFTSTVMSGVSVGPSAPWMARRLRAAGMRPISNVVDVSNYVMLELNQPNHAYDLDTLGGGGFRVRAAADGETITTLDGVERSLSGDDLLICDADDAPIGVAGVMGGLDTEITDETTTIALEVAWFEPVGVMQTAARLGLRSEASARFERGVDPHGIDLAIARFAELLRETSPGLVVHAGADDARSEHLPGERAAVTVRLPLVRRVLGDGIDGAEAKRLLDPIGFTTTPDPQSDTLTVSIPSWRPDSTAEIDVVEEIARHRGYDTIGKVLPTSTTHGALSTVQQRRRLLREVLLGAGLSEAMPSPFLAAETVARAGIDGDAIRITNPVVADEDLLRTSLRPGLLATVAFNASHRATGVRFFEIGHVYPPGSRTGALPDEYEALGIVLAGADAMAAVAIWREIAAALSIGARIDQSIVAPGLHPTRSATLTAGRDRIGVVGEIHPDVLDAFGISERVAVVELDLTTILDRSPAPPRAKPVSRFPSSDIDLAFVVDRSIAAERIEKALRQAAGALLADIELFDVYAGPGVADGARSLAYRLRFQAHDRTLTDAEVSALRDRCIAAVGKVGGRLRASASAAPASVPPDVS